MAVAFGASSVLRSLKRSSLRIRFFRPQIFHLPIRAGIAARLSIAFGGVAILAVAANLFVDRGLTVAALTSRDDPAAGLAHSRWLKESVARASVSVTDAVNRFERAT